MGLDQLRRSIELKARVDTTRGETQSRNITLKSTKKPLMERYRRQKINNYLEELKHLVLSALNKEACLYSKMEKADILDMAVKYIKAVRPTTPEAPTTEYRQRYENCMTTSTGYQVERASPLAVQSSNINYNNLQHSSQVVTKQVKKEKCTTIGTNTHCSQVTRTHDGTVQQQVCKQQQEYRLNETQTENGNAKVSYIITRTLDETQNPHQVHDQDNRFNQTITTQNENCNPSVATAIWRPW